MTHINREIARGEIENILGMGWTTQVHDGPDSRQRQTLGVLTGQSRRIIATMILEAIQSHALIENDTETADAEVTGEMDLAPVLETP